MKKNYVYKLVLCIFIVSLIVLFSSSACKKESDIRKIGQTEGSAPNEVQNTYKTNTTDTVHINKGVTLGNINMGLMTVEQAMVVLSQYALQENKVPHNATYHTKTWNIKQGTYGRELDISSTIERLIKAAAGSKVNPVFIKIKPIITSVELKKNVQIISSYSTTMLDRREARVNNIDLAVDEINFHILQPGEEFSFNDVLGRRTKDKGYKKAPIIIKTKKGPKKGKGVGGGICQVSTTLYNAARKAGLDIMERHPHSKDIKYAPRGHDATVVYGGADLKIKNSRKYPIMIRAYLGEKTVTVEIIENRM